MTRIFDNRNKNDLFSTSSELTEEQIKTLVCNKKNQQTNEVLVCIEKQANFFEKLENKTFAQRFEINKEIKKYTKKIEKLDNEISKINNKISNLKITYNII